MGPPNGANFLRNANGTGAHSYAKAVNAGIDEILRLSSRYNISTDHLREGNEGGNKQKEGRNKKIEATKRLKKQKEGGNKKREETSIKKSLNLWVTVGGGHLLRDTQSTWQQTIYLETGNLLGNPQQSKMKYFLEH